MTEIIDDVIASRRILDVMTEDDRKSADDEWQRIVETLAEVNVN